MNRETLDKFCERAILGLVLVILVYTPLAFGGRSQPAIGSSWDFIFVNPFNVVQWITLAVMVLWGARLWLTPRPKLLWPPICWAVVVFALYAIVRYHFSEIEYVARGEMIEVLMYAFLFLAIVNNLHRQESAQLITLTLVFLAMAISACAIYQFVTNSNRVWALIKPYSHRGTGTFISPNHLAGFLEMILPLGLAYTVTSRMKALPKIFTGYASLVIIAGIVVTVSRGSWFATAVALLIFFVILMFHHTHRVPAMVLLATIIIGSLYFGPRNVFFTSRITELTPDKAGVDGGLRFGIWQDALKLWHENIWWGVGPAHFNYRFGKYRPEAVQASPDRAHNDYLNTLTDWGVVGTVMVAAAWVLLFACAIWTWRFVRGSPNTLGDHRSNKLALVLGATIGLVAILIHSFVDFNMHIPANALVAVTLMALLSSYVRFATERYWFTARPAAKILLTTALAVGLVYLAGQSARSAHQSIWLMRAQRAPAASDQQIAALQKAFAAEPKNGETARAIGEAFRLQNLQNDDDSKGKTLEAIRWFKLAVAQNPYDDSSLLRTGMCLDWIGEHDEALPYFDRANRMDPNSYFNNAYMGWHYAQAGDYAAARAWLERSRMLESQNNPIAISYLTIVEDHLLQAATNSTPSQIHLGSSPNTIPAWK
jgi:O-antigen ligase